jgi:hypothetical protein
MPGGGAQVLGQAGFALEYRDLDAGALERVRGGEADRAGAGDENLFQCSDSKEPQPYTLSLMPYWRSAYQ